MAVTGACVALAGCASEAIDIAPERADRPWAPVVTVDGEIVPGPPERSGETPGLSYVLPPNGALGYVPPPPPGLDAKRAYALAELIDIAQINNPSTRVSWIEARNAALAVGIGESTYLPNLSAHIVGGYQAGRSRTSTLGQGVDENEHASGSILALSLQWLLFDFGERAASIEAAKQASVISNIAFTAAHQQVIYRVSLAYFAHAAAMARVATAANALKNAREVEASAESRYRNGVGTVVDVAEARQGSAQARLAQVRANGAAEDSYLSLLAAMGISPLTRIDIADISDRELSVSLAEPIEAFVSEALSRRPDTLSAFAAQEASLANLRAARAEFLPKVFLSATGSYSTGTLEVTAVPGAGQQLPALNISRRNLGATVLLGVTVPLYDGGVRDAMLKRAKGDVEKSDARLSEVRNEAVREIVSAANAAETSLAAYDAAKSLASASRTTFDAALESYRNGVGSITAVTIAETQLLQAEDAAADAYSGALAAAATLALAAGTLGAAPQ